MKCNKVLIKGYKIRLKCNKVFIKCNKLPKNKKK